LRGRHAGEEILRAGERDDVGDLFDFGLLHPAIFGEMDGGIGVGQKFADGAEAGAAVGEMDGEVCIEIVFLGPTGPDASDGRSGVDENAVHVEEEGTAGEGGHIGILMGICVGKRIANTNPTCPKTPGPNACNSFILGGRSVRFFIAQNHVFAQLLQMRNDSNICCQAPSKKDHSRKLGHKGDWYPRSLSRGWLVHLEFDTTIAELALIGIVGANDPGFAVALGD